MLRLEYHHKYLEKYPIIVGSDIDLCSILEKELSIQLCHIVIDRSVDQLGFTSLQRLYRKLSSYSSPMFLRGGEVIKSLTQLVNSIEELEKKGVQRHDCLIAIGGGTTSDFVGFMASIYMRGLQYVCIPTTLIGQVDASVGSKTGINFNNSKNLLGSFHHPTAVIIDVSFLKTLPESDLRNGLAETVKTAIIGSDYLFEYVGAKLDSIFKREKDILLGLVSCTIKTKLELLSPDPLECYLDRPLNFGHTIGHAIELDLSSSLSHGEAISIGMAAATRIAEERGMISYARYEEIINLIKAIGLPIALHIFDKDHLTRELSVIRRIRGGSLRFVVPSDLERIAILDDVTEGEILSACTND